MNTALALTLCVLANPYPIRQVTDNTVMDSGPSVWNHSIVWRAWTGTRYDILKLSNGSITNLSQILGSNGEGASISGNRVVWSRTRVYINDGTTTRRISNSYLYETTPDIELDKVVWSGDDGGGDHEIFQCDLTTNTITQLTVNGVEDRNPRTDGTNVVWWQAAYGSQGGPDDQVMLYDGVSVRQITPVGSTLHSGRAPDVSGGLVVYVGNDGGNDDDLFTYDIASQVTTQLTANANNDERPKIDGHRIVWEAYYGGPSPMFAICTMDLDTNVTDELIRSPFDHRESRISGNQIVWRGFDGIDHEIYSVTIPPFPDFNKDGYVNQPDVYHFLSCATGPDIPQSDGGCFDADLDDDADVDMVDFGMVQRCWSGSLPAASGCTQRVGG